MSNEENKKNTVCINVPQGEQVIISETDICDDEKEFKVRILVGANAHLTYLSVFEHTGSLFRTVEVSRDARVDIFDIRLTSGQSSTDVNLLGPGAAGYTYGLFWGKKEEEFFIHHTTSHLISDTYSQILVKGVLGGQARADYRGLIHVSKGAYRCEGYQREDTLMLSADAKIHTVPNLEIANHDVKCSHGVTTTHINRDTMFYFLSRGIGTREAESLMIFAHITPVLDCLPEDMNKKLKEKLACPC